MKYISFAIPCYNSEAYMEKCDQLNPYRRRRCRNSYRQRWFKRRNAGNRRTVRSSISDDRQGDPKMKTEDTAMQSTADFLMPQENTFKVVDSDDWD